MPIYLGPPGALQTLPYMGRDIDASLDLGVAEQRLLSGIRVADRVGTPKRTYRLERRFLTADEMGQIEGLALGLYGPEPYALIEPWRRNLLTLNQSSAGDFSHDGTGFTVFGAGASVTTSGPLSTASQGRYYQRYVSPSSGAAGTTGLAVGNSTSAALVLLPGNSTPVVVGLSYTFQFNVITLAGTAASWRAAINWYDSAGAFLSSSSGTTTVVTGSWVARTVTATAPASAAYAVPQVTNGATLSASNTIGIDALMLAQASAAGTWVPGTGVPRVAFTALGDVYPLSDAHHAGITLVEIG